jgi:Glu-tRNA(Gln) amidotransferase subunit E-like FAD-binding protein
MTDGNKKNGLVFNLFKLWKSEGLENDLAFYVKDLMVLMNALLKKYSTSDDVGEWSKNPELWDLISNSKEINQFVNSDDSKKIISKYTISKKEMDSLIYDVQDLKEVDFGMIKANVEIHSKTTTFFKSLINEMGGELDNIDLERIDLICHSITNQNELSEASLDFAQTLLSRVRADNPEIFDRIRMNENENLINAINFVIEQYNSTIENSGNMISNFDRWSKIAQVKGLKYDSVFAQIGKQLQDGQAPTIKQLNLISDSVTKMK